MCVWSKHQKQTRKWMSFDCASLTNQKTGHRSTLASMETALLVKQSFLRVCRHLQKCDVSANGQTLRGFARMHATMTLKRHVYDAGQTYNVSDSKRMRETLLAGQLIWWWRWWWWCKWCKWACKEEKKKPRRFGCDCGNGTTDDDDAAQTIDVGVSSAWWHRHSLQQ